jgi:hypothetical protein
MSAKKSIQFRSVPLIMEYYREYELPCWEILHDKVPIFRYDDDDQEMGAEKLQHKLNMLKKEGSAGIYTLRLYGDGNESLSCGFRLNEYSENYLPGVAGGVPAAYNEIMSELNAMKEEIKKLQDEDDDDDEGMAGLGQIGTLLENPLVQTLLAGVLQKFLPGQPQQQPQDQDPARPGGLHAINGVIINPQDQDQKIAQAIAALKQYDTQLGDHLLKLARIAETKPAKFKNLLMMLTFM